MVSYASGFSAHQNGYVRTVASETGAWQNSHTHSEFQELYLVERGWMAMAVQGQNDTIPIIHLIHPGQTFISPRGQTHNVYLPGNAVIHTIKFGIREPTALFEPRPEFDRVTKILSEQDIRRLASPQLN